MGRKVLKNMVIFMSRQWNDSEEDKNPTCLHTALAELWLNVSQHCPALAQRCVLALCLCIADRGGYSDLAGRVRQEWWTRCVSH